MVIINRLKKTIAALMALTISAASMGAISADATCEGQITLEDSKEVLTCYANNMSSIPYEGLTGKVQIKKILVPVPNNI